MNQKSCTNPFLQPNQSVAWEREQEWIIWAGFGNQAPCDRDIAGSRLTPVPSASGAHQAEVLTIAVEVGKETSKLCP